ncbi:MAG: kelch repeat-containing protein [Pseudomonadota bacterium]
MNYRNLAISITLLLCLTACGGGGGGGGDAPQPDAGPAPTTPPATPPSTPPPTTTTTSLGISLEAGAYWEFFGTAERFTFAQPNTNTSTIDVGRFRVTLGNSVMIGGQEAYPLELSGESQDFAPRWTHLAVDGSGSLLGSIDGASLSVVYDARTDEWVGGGFFVEFAPDEAVDFFEDVFDGNYNTHDALVAAHSTSSGGCEQIIGMTFCDDESTTFSEREFYLLGVGPIGYSLDTTYSDEGGGFFTSFRRKTRIELIQTSFTPQNGIAFVLPPWESVASLNVPRQNHRAYAADGRILVFAGSDADGAILDSVEVYDPATNKWTFSTPMPPGSYGSGGVIDGKVYLTDSLSGTFAVFDPVTESWSSEAPVNGDLPGLCDAAVYEDVTFGFGTMLVGANCNSAFVRSLSFSGYSPSTQSTVVSSGLNLGLSELLRFTVETVGDTMYVIGGFGRGGEPGRGARTAIWSFDVITGEWNTSPAAQMLEARDSHSSATLDNRVYVFGGAPVGCSDFNPDNCSRGNPLREAEVYDPETSTTEALPPMFTPRESFATVVLNGQIYAIGGDDGAEVTAKVERFSP